MAKKQRIVRSLRFLFEGTVVGEIADASQFQVPDDERSGGPERGGTSWIG
jgi:hypothetical protein